MKMKKNPLDWVRDTIYAKDDHTLMLIWCLGATLGLAMVGLLCMLLFPY